MHKPKHNQKKRTRIQPEGIENIKSRIWHKIFICHEDYIPKNRREEKIKQEVINGIFIDALENYDVKLLCEDKRMNTLLEPHDIVSVISSFMSCNEGDESTERLILSIGCELLDVSEDTLIDMIADYKHTI